MNKNGKNIAYFRRTLLKLDMLAADTEQRSVSYDTFSEKLKNEISRNTEWVKYTDHKI